MIAWAEVLGSILNTNNNTERKKDMEEERKAKNCELDIEEVNVYTDDCGVIKYECLHDCMGINAMISPWE